MQNYTIITDNLGWSSTIKIFDDTNQIFDLCKVSKVDTIIENRNFGGTIVATIEGFLKLDIRIGTILKAEPLEGARVPAIKLEIDFGETIGIKNSSAQITRRYEPEQLIGRQVVGIVNFPPRRIAGFKSEVLVLGGNPEEGDIVLLRPDEAVENGTSVC